MKASDFECSVCGKKSYEVPLYNTCVGSKVLDFRCSEHFEKKIDPDVKEIAELISRGD